MTLSALPRRADATGNGTASTFPFLFKIFDDDDLRVVVFNTTTKVETVLTKTTDYTVALTGPAPSAGSISLVDSDQAWLNSDGKLATGYTISILGDRDYSQETSIRNQRTIFPSVIENAWDKLCVLIQQLEERLDRAVVLRETSTESGITFGGDPISESDGELIQVNSAGTGLEPSGLTATQLAGYAGDAAADAAAAAASAASAAASLSAAEAAETNAEAAETAAEAAQAAALAAQAAAEAAVASVNGIPAGGSNGQVLKKSSGTDYDVAWASESTGGGTPIEEVLTGTFGGTDTTYTLSQTPLAAAEVKAFLGTGRVRQARTVDYSLSGTTITFASQDVSGESLLVDYRY